jgi:hypothetical protein
LKKAAWPRRKAAVPETWYDPEEIQEEADGLQRQPEFDQAPEDGLPERKPSAFDRWIARMNEINAIVAAEIAPNQEGY